MAPTIEHEADRRHLSLRETKPRMLKADLTKCETHDSWRVQIGAAIVRTRQLLGLNQKEFAAALGYDRTQIAKWESGTERPHVDAVFAVDALRQPLVIALAELAGEGVEIETVVRVRTMRRIA